MLARDEEEDDDDAELMLRQELREIEDALRVSTLKNLALEQLIDGMQTEQEAVWRKCEAAVASHPSSLATRGGRTRRGSRVISSPSASWRDRPGSMFDLRALATAASAHPAPALSGTYERTHSVPHGSIASTSEGAAAGRRVTRSNSGGLCIFFTSRVPGVSAPAVLDFGQPGRPALRPAKPLLELTSGGPRVASNYREWAEPLHGGLMIESPPGRAGLDEPSGFGGAGIRGRRCAISSEPWGGADDAAAGSDELATWTCEPGATALPGWGEACAAVASRRAHVAAALARHPLLQSASPELVAATCASMVEMDAEAGELVAGEGEESNAMYVVAEGVFEVRSRAHPRGHHYQPHTWPSRAHLGRALTGVHRSGGRGAGAAVHARRLLLSAWPRLAARAPGAIYYHWLR